MSKKKHPDLLAVDKHGKAIKKGDTVRSADGRTFTVAGVATARCVAHAREVEVAPPGEAVMGNAVRTLAATDDDVTVIWGS